MGQNSTLKEWPFVARFCGVGSEFRNHLMANNGVRHIQDVLASPGAGSSKKYRVTEIDFDPALISYATLVKMFLGADWLERNAAERQDDEPMAILDSSEAEFTYALGWLRDTAITQPDRRQILSRVEVRAIQHFTKVAA